MSFTTAAGIAVVTWCAIGFAVSVYMRRRGHAFFTWWYLGSILGPLSIPLAVDAVVRERQHGDAMTPTDVRPGKVGLLLGVDGSEMSIDAARSAVQLFGERIGRCTLAYVVDYDAAQDPSDRHDETDRVLDAAAAALATVACDRVVLVGAAAEALGSAACEGHYDVLVVGNRGQGASRAVLGSVASHLARGVGVPVLLGAKSIDTATTVTRSTSRSQP